ncbi:hypothetical protein DHW03_15230 [Pedobacter yonginense]|uniref:Uncharacterized protein n=1 Tax=Pedobacter yonginense TaxID=651869 RepID=A0A317ELI0_9SPHI|nr:hypothetical protein [Pedobacter yonginense]PWS26146.1 hypothetical protein DHW03_15230 [Pedobacter yonginense]
MQIESIDDNNTIALIKIRLENAENYFVSYNSLVLDVNNEWMIISNVALVAAKNLSPTNR